VRGFLGKEKNEELVTQINLEKTMELLGSTDIPGTPEQKEEIVRWMQRLVKDHGEEWVRQSRKRLLDEWEYVLNIGLDLDHNE
jgi:hypothetical protein